MVRTEDQFPEDVEYRIDTLRSHIDIPRFVVMMLRQEWISTNTNGHIPQIDHSEFVSVGRISTHDNLTIYMRDVFIEPHAIEYAFESETIPISIDVQTKGPREHFLRVLEEIKRIIHLKRKNPFGTPSETNITGRQWLKLVRVSPQDRITKNVWKATIDFDVMWRFREIQT